MASRLRGVLAPVVTPFGADLAPDAARWIAHCRGLLSRDCGLAIFGTTSEANSLALSERRALLEAAAEALDPGRMMVGTGACAIPEAAELTRASVEAGCAGVLMLPPFYYKGVPEDGLFAYYSEVIERVGDARLRVYLYHIPAVSGVPIPHSLIARLREAYPNAIAGIKDSSGDWENARAMIERFEGFDVYAGTEALLLPALRAGGAGCITATANVNPGPIAALCASWEEEGAEARQAALTALRRAFEAVPMIPGLKAALARATGDATWARVRPPLVALDTEGVAGLGEALAAAGLPWPDAP